MVRVQLAKDFLEWCGLDCAPTHKHLQTAFADSPTGSWLGAPPGMPKDHSDAEIEQKLGGVDKDLKDMGTSEDEVIDTAFGHQVISHEDPKLDLRKHDELTASETRVPGFENPGGDVMGQLAMQKWVASAPPADAANVPKEEDWYMGAKLGEMARPLIMGEGKVGYLNQAPVPMSPSEDLLTLVGESGVGSRRARHAAEYAKMSSLQALEFFRLAQRRARQIFHDPPVNVRPGADVFPLYSASSPAFLALAAPPVTRRSQSQCLVSSSAPPKRAKRNRSDGFL